MLLFERYATNPVQGAQGSTPFLHHFIRTMAQREFILILLAVIIVALAAVAGIYSFADGAAKNRRDMIANRSVEFAAFSQEWAATPNQFGGGSGSFDGIDIWKVTDDSGTGDWIVENETRYSVEQLEAPNQHLARVTAEDSALDLQIVMTFDGSQILSTEYLRGGVIYF